MDNNTAIPLVKFDPLIVAVLLHDRGPDIRVSFVMMRIRVAM